MKVLVVIGVVLAVVALGATAAGVWMLADEVDQANAKADVAACIAKAEASNPVLVRSTKNGDPLGITPVDKVTGLDERRSAVNAC